MRKLLTLFLCLYLPFAPMMANAATVRIAGTTLSVTDGGGTGPVDAWTPILPQFDVDTTLPTGWDGTADATPADSAAFQTALDNVDQDDDGVYIIELTAGATYTGPFAVHEKPGDDWLIIRTSDDDLPATGTRVVAADATDMAKITGTGTGATSCGLYHEFGAHHVRYIGIEFTSTHTTTTGTATIVHIGYDPNINHYTTAEDEPHHIIFDRCYVHGTSTGNSRQGLYFNAAYGAVIDCRIDKIHEVGGETQGIFIFQGAGPYLISNNYIEAGTENIMIGGADPAITNRVPSDITITRNHLFKPLTWKADDASYAGILWLIKNHFEIKNAKRVLFEGNVCENCWASSQAGYSILLTPRNQDGFASWCTCEDVTCRKNLIKNSAQGFQILSGDVASQNATRLKIENNVVETDPATNGGNGRMFQLSANPSNTAEYLTISHNTMIHKSTGTTFITIGDEAKFGETMRINDNISSSGLYGVHTPSGVGTTGLNAFITSYTFSNNALILDGQTLGTHPATTVYPADPAACNFTNYATGDYTITSGALNNAGSDGTDIGADIGALNTAISGVEE